MHSELIKGNYGWIKIANTKFEYKVRNLKFIEIISFATTSVIF